MITSATTPAQQAEFARRIAGKPYFAAVMGTALTLFGQKPGSGWSFYLLPGGALALRGGTATLCGALPDADTAEELQSFLQFVCTDRVLTEQPLPFGTEALNLKASGQRNTDAIVLTEASCLVLRYPKAHMRVVMA